MPPDRGDTGNTTQTGKTMTTNAATKARTTKSVSKGTSAPISPAKAKAVTDAEQAVQLDSLIMAVKVGVTSLGKQNTGHAEALNLYTQAQNALNDSRVIVARALAMLAEHPATFAKSGPTKGQPSLMTIATLTGYKRTTLYPIWEASKVLTAKKWEKRNIAPTQQERDIVAGKFDEKQVTRKANDSTKATKETKGKSAPVKTIKAGTLEDVVAILADALKVVQAYGKDHGITESQFDGLSGQLDLIHDELDGIRATSHGDESDADSE